MFKKITKRNKIIILVIGGLSVLLLILLMFCIFENSKKTSTPKPSLSNKVSELRQTLDLDEYTVPKIKGSY
ncbi:hypothetical protein ['Camptotheca acuminata' phytoplasma]|uniref:hypothetical protein n=1 Tax='Camptotheca acuminata' phytoplasma TaxID=3239192 RepID=UPI00351A2431